jgi:hypothetical protein
MFFTWSTPNHLHSGIGLYPARCRPLWTRRRRVTVARRYVSGRRAGGAPSSDEIDYAASSATTAPMSTMDPQRESGREAGPAGGRLAVPHHRSGRLPHPHSERRALTHFSARDTETPAPGPTHSRREAVSRAGVVVSPTRGQVGGRLRDGVRHPPMMCAVARWGLLPAAGDAAPARAAANMRVTSARARAWSRSAHTAAQALPRAVPRRFSPNTR